MKARVAVIFGQYGVVADPINLPRFRFRLTSAGVETIMVQHFDTAKVVDFLKGYEGFCATAGSSLGAMSAVVFARYLMPQTVHFVGGFQPSDYDPSGHFVNIPLHYEGNPVTYDVVTRAINVPSNVRESLCFRNPVAAATGGLGHAMFVADDPAKTKLTVRERLDVHPGDFGPAQDEMYETVMSQIK